jgi:hypothetical protein
MLVLNIMFQNFDTDCSSLQHLLPAAYFKKMYQVNQLPWLIYCYKQDLYKVSSAIMTDFKLIYEIYIVALQVYTVCNER